MKYRILASCSFKSARLHCAVYLVWCVSYHFEITLLAAQLVYLKWQSLLHFRVSRIQMNSGTAHAAGKENEEVQFCTLFPNTSPEQNAEHKREPVF